MRVLIVYPGIYVYGGAELVIVRLANYLTKKGIKNALLTTSILPQIQKDLILTDIIIQKELRRIPFNRPTFDLLNEIITLHNGVHSNLANFDLINVHNFPAELSTFPSPKPVVWMCNEPPHIYWQCFRKTVKAIFSFSHKFIVKNYIKNVVVADEFNAERFRRIYGFRPEIINYGIDYDFFSKGEKEKALQEFSLGNNFILLQVGMLTPWKNQMESVKTIERLKGRIPKIKLILAGWGEDTYIRMLQGYIKKKNLGNEVIITGQLSRQSLRGLYHACCAFLHPIKAQGGWLAPFEALSCRRPVVVSAEMTASDIIKREKIGIVTEDFPGAILDIYKNPDKYKEIATRGARWVKENLSWDIFCEKMLQIFLKAAAVD